MQAHQQYGNSWSQIAKLFPGRTDNSIKNRWNCTLSRKARERTLHTAPRCTSTQRQRAPTVLYLRRFVSMLPVFCGIRPWPALIRPPPCANAPHSAPSPGLGDVSARSFYVECTDRPALAAFVIIPSDFFTCQLCSPGPTLSARLAAQQAEGGAKGEHSGKGGSPELSAGFEGSSGKEQESGDRSGSGGGEQERGEERSLAGGEDGDSLGDDSDETAAAAVISGFTAGSGAARASGRVSQGARGRGGQGDRAEAKRRRRERETPLVLAASALFSLGADTAGSERHSGGSKAERSPSPALAAEAQGTPAQAVADAAEAAGEVAAECGEGSEGGEGGGDAAAMAAAVALGFLPGSIKHAAFTLLSREGSAAAGMSAAAIVEQAEAEGLRSWGACKTPVNSVISVLSAHRAFVRVSPSTYALAAVMQAREVRESCALRAVADAAAEAAAADAAEAAEAVAAMAQVGGGARRARRPLARASGGEDVGGFGGGAAVGDEKKRRSAAQKQNWEDEEDEQQCLAAVSVLVSA